MKAFVLSGGGNYGALQAGGLQPLLAAGIQPEMILGTSAGALNAAWLAAHPNLEGTRSLARLWRESAPRVISPLRQARDLQRGRDGAFSAAPVERLLCRLLPAESRFGDFTRPRLFTLASRLEDGALRVFGDDPDDRLVDGVMSSMALPPLFPPWVVGDTAYIDGGVVSFLPIRAAVERGADEIFALATLPPGLLPEDEQPGTRLAGRPHGLFAVGIHTVMMMLAQQAKAEVEWAHGQPGVRLHLIRLWPEADPGFWNFSRAGEMILDGCCQAEEYLSR